MKPVLIGQAPAKTGDPNRPLLDVRTADKLMDLTGTTPQEYLELFDRYNLLSKYPGKKGRGDLWLASEAKYAAGALLPLLHERQVVMLGRNVANAFGIQNGYPYLVWNKMDFYGIPRYITSAPPLELGPDLYTMTVMVLPHPSGVNRWYNDPVNEAAARTAMHKLAGK